MKHMIKSNIYRINYSINDPKVMKVIQGQKNIIAQTIEAAILTIRDEYADSLHDIYLIKRMSPCYVSYVSKQILNEE